MHVPVWFVLGYLAGSFPTSVVVSRFLGGFDIREKGSGNAGATNVFRVMGWKAGLPVALLDVIKGFVPALLAGMLPSLGGLLPDPAAAYSGSAAGAGAAAAAFAVFPMLLQVTAGTGAVLGHMFPVYAGFRGGKGVATSAGAVLALFAPIVPPLLAVFALVLFATGIVSLSSIMTATALPLAYLLIASGVGGVRTELLAFFAFLMVMVIFKHRGNIGRLLAGEERRFERIRIANMLRRLRKKGRSSGDKG